MNKLDTVNIIEFNSTVPKVKKREPFSFSTAINSLKKEKKKVLARFLVRNKINHNPEDRIYLNPPGEVLPRK